MEKGDQEKKNSDRSRICQDVGDNYLSNVRSVFCVATVIHSDSFHIMPLADSNLTCNMCKMND